MANNLSASLSSPNVSTLFWEKSRQQGTVCKQTGKRNAIIGRFYRDYGYKCQITNGNGTYLCNRGHTPTIVNHTDRPIYRHFLTRTRQPPFSVTIDGPTALLTDALTATTPEALRTRFLAHLASMSPKVSGKLQNWQRPYKDYFDQQIRTMPKIHIGQMVYGHRPPFATSSTGNSSDNYNKLLTKAYGPFQSYKSPGTPSRWMNIAVEMSYRLTTPPWLR